MIIRTDVPIERQIVIESNFECFNLAFKVNANCDLKFRFVSIMSKYKTLTMVIKLKITLITIFLFVTTLTHAEDSIVRSKRIKQFYSLSYFDTDKLLYKVEIFNNDHTLSSTYKFSLENGNIKIDSIYLYNHGILEQQNKVVLSDQPAKNDSNYTVCYYRGGQEKFYEYLSDNLKYPKVCLEKGIEGTCWVNFIVSREGLMVGPFSNDHDLHSLLVEEALRIIKATDGKWESAISLGVPTFQYCKIPIQFEFE